ncbi:MAG: hypothetical protein BGO25_04080 [Acidobacteriales bacterium 59-55]|nr:MAG: hypothetical protein BGO25_04080 [Acidobacteriales bacterium 59-55]
MGRVVDRRRSKQWLLNGFFAGSRNSQYLRGKCGSLYYNEMCAAAQAVITGGWALVLMLTLRL